jgi:outer membrane protein assembly factor BamA
MVGSRFSGVKYDIENESSVKESFKMEQLASNLRLGYHLGLDGEAIINLQLEKAKFSNKEITTYNEAELGIDFDKEIVCLNPILKFDTRDRSDYPTSGFYLKISGNFSRKSISSDFDFEKFKIDGRKYFTPWKDHTIATRFIFGTSKGNIPYFYLFDIGGMNGLRVPGYSNYTGVKVVLFNIEYRFHLFDALILFGEWGEGIIFVDVGRTWDEGENISLRDLDYAFGPGFRFHFPMPVFVDIRLEYGFGRKERGFYFGIQGGF